MAEYPMEGPSSELYVPDDMIEDSYNYSNSNSCPPTATVPITVPASVASSRQPKSLRSLANFTKSSPVDLTDAPTSAMNRAEHSLEGDQLDTHLDANMGSVSMEMELQHGRTTFVALESDLGALFGPPASPKQQQQHLHDYSSSAYVPTSSSSSISKSFSRSEFEQEIIQLKEKEAEARRALKETNEREINLQNQMLQMKSTIDQLELDNIDLSEEVDKLSKENKRLKEDCDLQVQDIQNTLHDLKMNLKEKDEDLQRTEKGRTMLLSKVGSHDSLKEENMAMTRELAEKTNEISSLQSQLSSSAGRVTQMQQEVDRLSSDLATSQLEAERRRNELESKRKDCESLKDALSLQKIDLDREFNRQENKQRDMEAEIRRLEDLNRSLQVDGNDRTHSESRLKSELNAADHRVQNLEAENSSLRRHLLDVTEGKDREISQALASNASFESANRLLTDEVNQLRRSVAQLQAAAAHAQQYPQSTSSSVAPPMHHHPTHSFQSQQPSPPVQSVTPAQYHAPPPPRSIQSSNSYRDMYPPSERAKKDAEFPAHKSSSLDYNSRRESEMRRGGSTLPPPPSSRYPAQPTATDSQRVRKDAEYPSHLASSLDYNSQRESEMRRTNSNDSSRYASHDTQGSRYQQSQQQQYQQQDAPSSSSSSSSARSLRGYATNGQETSSSSAPTTGSAVRSLASLVASGGTGSANTQPSSGKRGVAQSSSSPFATTETASHLHTFDQLEMQLTGFMTEKTTLSQELERLHQRGGKTLKDRTRFVQVEARLDELSKDIGRTRRQLAQKPS